MLWTEMTHSKLGMLSACMPLSVEKTWIPHREGVGRIKQVNLPGSQNL